MKGCQRRMIVVRGREQSVFETAYFVLRRECEGRALRETDMLTEANRIIDESQMRERRRRGRRAGAGRLWGVLLTLGGGLCGCGVTLVILHFFGG